MKNFLEKFKSVSLGKRIIFIIAITYIVGMFVYKFVVNKATIQLGIPYLITTILVYLVKIAILLLVVKIISMIIKKIKKSKR